MQRVLVLLLLSLTFLVACNNTKVKEATSAVVAGDMPKLEGETILLEEIGIQDFVLVDSAHLKGNTSFVFRAQPDDFGFYVLRTPSQVMPLPLILRKEEKLSVQLKEHALIIDAEIEGSEENKTLQHYFQYQRDDYDKLDQLYAYFEEHKYDPSFEKIRDSLVLQSKAILTSHREYAKSLIEKYKGTPLSLMIINQRLGQERLFDYEKDYSLYREVDSILLSQYPENLQVLDFHKRFSQVERAKIKERMELAALQPGEIAPELSLPDTNGTFYALGELKGKHVLLAFCGGWENKTYEDLKQIENLSAAMEDKNMTAYICCMDVLPEVWKTQVVLTHFPVLCDERGTDSPLVKLYKLPPQLPVYYLLDDNNVIVKREFDIDELPTILKEL